MQLHTIKLDQIYMKAFIKTKQKFLLVNKSTLFNLKEGDLLKIEIIGEHKPIHIEFYKNPFRITHVKQGDGTVLNKDYYILGVKELK